MFTVQEAGLLKSTCLMRLCLFVAYSLDNRSSQPFLNLRRHVVLDVIIDHDVVAQFGEMHSIGLMFR